MVERNTFRDGQKLTYAGKLKDCQCHRKRGTPETARGGRNTQETGDEVSMASGWYDSNPEPQTPTGGEVDMDRHTKSRKASSRGSLAGSADQDCFRPLGGCMTGSDAHRSVALKARCEPSPK